MFTPSASSTCKVEISTSLGVLEANFSEHSVGSDVCLRLKVKVSRSFSPMAILKKADDWAFVWRGRDDGFLTLALDALSIVAENDRMKMSRDSILQWFGGQPFANDGSEEWGELSHGLWFLPAITWKLTSDQCILIVQTLSTERNAREALVEKLQRVLEAEVDSAEFVPRAPRILGRADTPTFAGWTRSLEAARRAFREGTFSKVVLSRSSLLSLDQSDSWLYWVNRLIGYQEESYVFALKSPDNRCFLGRSPERLLAWKDGVFQVDAIAGTKRRGGDAGLDREASLELKGSPKELIEHRYVTQYVARLLERLQLNYEVIDDEKLLRLTHVQHLRTRFQGRLNPHVDALELLNALHPTPAVGGLPTQEAIDFILEHEESERGFYAGYIGWCGGASGECAIGIRSALVNDSSLRVFAGAGIVQESNILAEWEETEMKMQNFLFGLDVIPKKPSAESTVLEHSKLI